MHSWIASPFVLSCATVLGVLTLVVGIGQYRRGERWLLVSLLTVPAGALLGIYATDHDSRMLGLLGAAVLMTGLVVRSVIRRRHTAEDGRRATSG